MNRKSIFEMDHTKQLTYISKRVQTLLDTNRTQDLFELFHTDMPTAVLQNIEKHLSSGNPWKGHVMIKYDGNNIEWQQLYIAHNSHNNGYIGYLMPADEETLLNTIFEYSSLKQHESNNRLGSHIKVRNMALESISA